MAGAGASPKSIGAKVSMAEDLATKQSVLAYSFFLVILI
jgi:hypothetical protein